MYSVLAPFPPLPCFHVASLPFILLCSLGCVDGIVHEKQWNRKLPLSPVQSLNQAMWILHYSSFRGGEKLNKPAAFIMSRTDFNLRLPAGTAPYTWRACVILHSEADTLSRLICARSQRRCKDCKGKVRKRDGSLRHVSLLINPRKMRLPPIRRLLNTFINSFLRGNDARVPSVIAVPGSSFEFYRVSYRVRS